LVAVCTAIGGWATSRHPALPSLTQPVNEPRRCGSAGRAGERRLDPRREVARRRATWRRACFPVVLDPIGDTGVVVALPPAVTSASLVASASAVVSAGVVVSVPPPLPVALEAQLDMVIVLVSIVTAAVRAKSLPWIVAAVFAVMLSKAITVPTKRVPVPSVAEEPTCQKTLHACAPLTSDTLVFEPVISVEPIWKMNTALGSP
jgi:hypothetical protein